MTSDDIDKKMSSEAASVKLHTPGFTEVGGLLMLPHGARAEARAKEGEVVAERPCSAIAVGRLRGQAGMLGRGCEV